MATETLNLNLNEANPPEETPAKTLDLPATTERDLLEEPSAQQPSSTINDGKGSSQKDVDGTLVPKGLVAGNAAPDSHIQRKIRRAERFGVSVQLSESEKRNSRAERFGTAPTSQKVDAPNKSEGADASKKEDEMKRKARAERFGLPIPSEGTDEEAKKKARVARFAPPPKVDAVEEDKRKARALRFSEAPSSSPTEANGKGNIGPKAAIAGKATGGA